MEEDLKVCSVCEAMRVRLEDRKFEYVLADAWVGSGVETDFEQLERLNVELQTAEAEYKKAQADLVRHYQEHHAVSV